MLLFDWLQRSFFPAGRKEMDPVGAYDRWAAAYDSQPDNLMLALDEQITTELLSDIDLQSRTVVDIGCGTGRHWAKLRSRSPASIIGFDVSPAMLGMLKQKYPEAETFVLADNRLTALADETADLVLSTLTIAHIADPAQALAEWRRVLKPGGRMIITDYHPAALLKGARRTFSHQGQTIAIVNHVHSLDKINQITAQLGLRQHRFMESRIDESMKPYYERQQALGVYKKFAGTPIIYGICLIKTHEAAAG